MSLPSEVERTYILEPPKTPKIHRRANICKWSQFKKETSIHSRKEKLGPGRLFESLSQMPEPYCPCIIQLLPNKPRWIGFSVTGIQKNPNSFFTEEAPKLLKTKMIPNEKERKKLLSITRLHSIRKHR